MSLSRKQMQDALSLFGIKNIKAGDLVFPAAPELKEGNNYRFHVWDYYSLPFNKIFSEDQIAAIEGRANQGIAIANESEAGSRRQFLKALRVKDWSVVVCTEMKNSGSDTGDCGYQILLNAFTVNQPHGMYTLSNINIQFQGFGLLAAIDAVKESLINQLERYKLYCMIEEACNIEKLAAEYCCFDSDDNPCPGMLSAFRRRQFASRFAVLNDY